MTDVETLLGWADVGQQRVEAAVAEMAPEDVAAPSGLPDWTRGHVITHLARNADALVNLLTWARTGVPTPMYASPEQRAADISAGAGRGLVEQAADLRAAGRRFAEAAAALPPEAWSARVVSGQGRDIAASLIPWLRVREVWIHLVDLDLGLEVDVLPDDVAAALVRDVAAWMSPKLERAARLEPLGADPVPLGPAGGTPSCVVSGSAARIAGWLIGRSDTNGLTVAGTPPTLPRWL